VAAAAGGGGGGALGLMVVVVVVCVGHGRTIMGDGQYPIYICLDTTTTTTTTASALDSSSLLLLSYSHDGNLWCPHLLFTWWRDDTHLVESLLAIPAAAPPPLIM